MVRVCLIVLALVVAAVPAWAQQLQLDIRDGLVTLSATNVPVRQVLAEWAKVGGTRVTGAERITGAPLTLKLEGVPEAKALDIVLRGAAGYMAATRSEPAAGRSMYDRIMVLASSTPPASGPGAATAAARPAANRFGVPPVIEPPDPGESVSEAPDVADLQQQQQGNPFADAFAQQGGTNPFAQGVNPFTQQGPNPFGQPIQPTPFGQPTQQLGQPTLQQGGSFFQPLQPAQAPPPSGFFGVPGSVSPGMVQQPVVPPGQPVVRPRPQG